MGLAEERFPLGSCSRDFALKHQCPSDTFGVHTETCGSLPEGTSFTLTNPSRWNQESPKHKHDRSRVLMDELFEDAKTLSQ
jgi:hypothetical protein